MLRGIFRFGVFGQQRCFIVQPAQSLFDVRYSSVSAEVGFPVVFSFLPPGHVYAFSCASKVKSERLNVPSSRLAFSQTGMCGSTCRSLTIQFRSGAAP